MGKKEDVSQNLQQKLTLVTRSGKFKIGYKLALKQLRAGTSKLLIIANNCPPIRKTELEYLAILGGSKVLHWDGNNVELGTAIGRLHRVCVVSIENFGDSDLLTSV